MDFTITPDTSEYIQRFADNNDVDEEESKEFDPIDDEEEFRDLNDTHLHHIRRNLKI